MKTDNKARQRIDRVWLTEEACDLESFRAEVERQTSLSDYPHASGCEKNILIYDSAALIAACGDAEARRSVLAEICEVLATGPGVAVFKRAFADTTAIDVASGVFGAIIEE